MSATPYLTLQIQDLILEGRLTYQQIAQALEIPFSWVDQVGQTMASMDAYVQDNDYLDSDCHLDYLD